MRHCCMAQSPLDGRSVGGAGAGSIPTCRAKARHGQIQHREVKTMEKEPIYRVKVEVIGEEPEGFKIDESLRGG